MAKIHYCEIHRCWSDKKLCVACEAEFYNRAVSAGTRLKVELVAGGTQRDIDPDEHTIRLRAAMVKAMALCGAKDAIKLARELESGSLKNKVILDKVGLTEDTLNEKEEDS